MVSHSPSLDASDSCFSAPWEWCCNPPSSPLSPPLPPSPPPLIPNVTSAPVPLSLPALDPLPLSQKAEAGGQGAMVTHSRHTPPVMSSIPPPEASGRASNLTPHRYKPFSSHAHYQQVMCALRKLQESGFYWGAVEGREASSLLRSEPPGTFLVRDSSNHHHFFTLSVQTACGTKNLRIHSEGGGFFLQPDARSTQTAPHFDCVLKLIAHYMGNGACGGGLNEGEAGGDTGATGGNVYLIHTGGERVPLELRRPLSSSLSSLQHLCRKTLNGQLGAAERAEHLPHPLRDFLEEYDAPI